MSDNSVTRKQKLNSRGELRHILLIFVDGLGIGENNPDKNPCAQTGVRFFNNFITDVFPKDVAFDGLAMGIDVSMGIAGLPQSATGQTALLTGVNASAALGRHLNGFPNERLRQIIAGESILKQFNRNGHQAAFINTFRPPFFDYDPYDIIRHLSVTSVANFYAGLPFFNLDDLRAEKSIYQEFTNEHLRAKGFDVPVFSPQKAGEILARQAQNYDFCLYEYFQTDIAGHSLDMKRALAEVTKLEQFLESVLAHISLEYTLIILTSDHGNIEDISVKGHTSNHAMTLIWGAMKKYMVEGIKEITDVTPAIISLWGENKRI